MSKSFRYALSIAIMLVLALALCITVCAEETGTCTDTITWTLDDNGVLTFSGEGDMPDYATEYKTPWVTHQNKVKKLVFEDGITSIGERAFAGYTNLEEIVVEGKMTHIGYEAFYQASFKNLTIENVKEIGERAFCRNLSLQTLTIGEGVEILSDQAFSYCTGLSKINLTEGLKELNYYSFYASIITEITIPESVELVGKEAFYKCEKLESVTFLGGVKEIGSYAFGHCVALDNVVLQEGVRKIGDLAFHGCTSLKEIFVPCSVYNIGERAFYTTKNLNYPVNTVVKGYTGSIAEYNAKQYGEEYFFTFESVGEAPDMELCTGNWGDNITWTISTNGILTINGEGIAPELNYLSWAYYSGYVKKLIIEDGIHMMPSWYAEKHTNLTEIDTGSGLVKFDGMLYVPNLEKVYGYENSCVHKAVPSGVEFISKGEITERVIIEGDINTTSWSVTNLGKLTIWGEGAVEHFSNAYDYPWYPYRRVIESLEICEGITSIGSYAYWYSYYPAISEATIHHTVLDFESGLLKDNVILYAYQYSSAGDTAERDNLDYISLGTAPKRILATGYAGENITWEYDNYRNMIITGSGDMDQNLINWNSYMKYAENIEISEGITSIEGYAFKNAQITSLVIPNTVTYISSYAFEYCSKLKEITLPYSLLKITSNTFSDVSIKTIKGYKGSFAEIYAKNSGKKFVSLGQIPEKVEITYPLTDTISYTVDNFGTMTVFGEGDMPDYTYSYYGNGMNPPWYCNMICGLRRVVIGEGITSIGRDNFCMGRYIKNVELPSTLKTIGIRAFMGTEIEELVIPDGVESVGYSAFSDCNKLEKVWLSEAMTTISQYCFRYCRNLVAINVPKSVNTIISDAFQYSGLQDLYYEGTPAYWTTSVTGKEYVPETAKIHFASLACYKIASVEIIDDYPYVVDVVCEGENDGVILVALMKDGMVVEVLSEKTDDFYSFARGNTGDTICVYWFKSAESMEPLCNEYEYELPQNNVERVFKENSEIYSEFYENLKAEDSHITDELLMNFVDYTRDLAVEEVSNKGEELTIESFEENLSYAMTRTLVSLRKFIYIRNAMLECYPDAIGELWNNEVITEDFIPWAETAKALQFN